MRLLKRVEDNGGDTGRMMGSERRGGRRLSAEVIGSEENLWLFLLRLRVFVDGGVLSMVELKENNSIQLCYRDDITVTCLYPLNVVGMECI